MVINDYTATLRSIEIESLASENFHNLIGVC